MGDIFGGDAFWQFLSANRVILAVANVGGIIGLCVLAWHSAKRSMAFAKVAWHQNVRAALAQAKRRRVRHVGWCASDIYFFVGMASIRIIAAIGSVAVLALPLLINTMPDEAHLHLAANANFYRSVLAKINSAIAAIYALITALSIIRSMLFFRLVLKKRASMIIRRARVDARRKDVHPLD
jgi:hypothetical protein